MSDERKFAIAGGAVNKMQKLEEAGGPVPAVVKQQQADAKAKSAGAPAAATSRSTAAQPGIGSTVKQNLGIASSASQVKPSGMSGNYPRSAQGTTTMGQASQQAGKDAVSRIKSAQKPAMGAREPNDKTGSTSGSGGLARPLQQTRQNNMADAMNRKTRVAQAQKSGGTLTGREDKWQASINPAPSTAAKDKAPAPQSSSSTQAMQRGAEQDKVGMKRPGATAPATKTTSSVVPKPKPKPTGVKPNVQPTSGGAQTNKPTGNAKNPALSAAARREARRRLDKGAVGPEAKKLQRDSGLGVTTGKTIRQKPGRIVRRPVGMGREK